MRTAQAIARPRETLRTQSRTPPSTGTRTSTRAASRVLLSALAVLGLVACADDGGAARASVDILITGGTVVTHGNEVSTVLVNGRVLMRDRVVLSVNETPEGFWGRSRFP